MPKNTVFWWTNGDACGTHRSPAQDVLGDVRSFRSIPLDGVGVWLVRALCDDHLNRPRGPWKKELLFLTYWRCFYSAFFVESSKRRKVAWLTYYGYTQEMNAIVFPPLMLHHYVKNWWIRIYFLGGKLTSPVWVHFLWAVNQIENRRSPVQKKSTKQRCIVQREGAPQQLTTFIN